MIQHSQYPQFTRRSINSTDNETEIGQRRTLQTDVDYEPRRKVILVHKRKIFFIAGIVVLFFIALGVLAFFTDIGDKSFLALNGEGKDRTNILLVGVGGEQHPGGSLADMITIVSLNHKTKQIGMLSIPRDLEVTTKYGTGKINSVRAYAYNQDKDKAQEAMKDVVKDVTGLDIHYYAELDFPGFVEFIDAIGGVDVDVEQSFYDWYYPNPKYNNKLSWKAGTEHMNGEWALNYARSRHGDNGEGSDMRRAKHHQDLLIAIKKKALEDKTYLDIAKILEIMGIVDKHLTTDIGKREITRFLKIYTKYDKENIASVVLDNSPNGPLVAGRSSGGGYVLRPKDPDFSDIHDIATFLFDQGKISEESASVEIQNGTGVSGLGIETSGEVREMGFSVSRIRNAITKQYSENVIFDNSNGGKARSLAKLAKHYNARVISQKVEDSQADFVLVLFKE